MNELIDLVDASGKVLKAKVTRDDAKKHNGLHMQIVIAVVTNSSGHILVHKRAKTKSVNPGDIDHVCGGILSGETPEQAAIREAREETGVELHDIKIVRQGVNSYGRYCYLVRAYSDDDASGKLDPKEVAWANYHPVTELHDQHKTGTFTFVDGFFEDLQHALGFSAS